MIPTKTPRERMREALEADAREVAAFRKGGAALTGRILDRMVDAAIDAIGDPIFAKIADTLEPTFTLRAQDKAAELALRTWIEEAQENDCASEKVSDARSLCYAFQSWTNRKWPD